MSSTVRNLEPKALWNHFADLNAVPRPSKKEERVIKFAREFGEGLGLETTVDHIGNVIITKPATSGMEDRETVVIQSHLDMVHQKNASVEFDFLSEGIKMFSKGDWVRAEGTTLGADNGIGVAAIMAVLSSKDIPHPKIEALFTIDEETGMTGALELKGGLLTGKILLNLDTEDDDELTIGCAGGVDVSASGRYEEVAVNEDFMFVEISVTGLSGGHSGVDIHRGLGNANKIMNRLLFELMKSKNLFINSIDGGSLRNAIPRESFAKIAINSASISELREVLSPLIVQLKNEYGFTDPELNIEMSESGAFEKAMSGEEVISFVKAIYACPSGIYRMHSEIEGLVQTSNNLARVSLHSGEFEVLCLTRSSVDSEKEDMKNLISSVFSLIGGEMSFSGNYPGWEPKPNAEIIQTMKNLYKKNFDADIHVAAIHAGLECGIIGTHYPDMEMVSFGPNIRGAHSPDERVQISSVQKFWKFFLDVLANIPVAT